MASLMRQDLQELRGSEEELAQQQARAAAGVERLAGLADDVQALRGELQELRSGDEELRGELRQLRSDHAALADSEKADKEQAEQIREVLRRVGEGEEATRALEARLEQVQKDAAPSGEPGGGELASRLAEVAQRVAGGEEKLAAVQKQLEKPLQDLEARLDQLGSDHAALKQAHSRDEDLSDRLVESAKRIASSEEAITALREQQERLQSTERQPVQQATEPGLAERVSELSRRVAGGEEGTDALRSDLRVAEASLKDVFAQMERLAAQAEAKEAVGRPLKGPAESSGDAEPPAGIEAQVRELERQVSEELSALAQHQQDLVRATPRAGAAPEPPAGPAAASVYTEGMEKLVAELANQVSTELQELLEHQQGLKKVKELMTALSDKVTTPEQSMPNGEGTSIGVAPSSLSKLEARVDDLCTQVKSGALAGAKAGSEESGEPRSKVLEERLEEALRRLEEGEQAAEGLRRRLQQLQFEHEELAQTKSLGADLADRVSEVLQRIEGGEEKIAVVQKQLEQPIRALDQRLEQLRGDYEALRQTKVLHSDLTGRISEVVQRVASSEEAIATLQKRPEHAGGSNGYPRADLADCALKAEAAADARPPAEVEAQVRELQRQVREELESLTRHQRELTQARLAAPPGRAEASAEASGGEEVERAVADLSRQVCVELQELREHQEGLGKVRAAVAALAEQSEARLPALADEAGEVSPERHLDAKVQELSRQAAAELQALASQQGELGQARASLGDLARQMRELQQHVEELRGGRARPGA